MPPYNIYFHAIYSIDHIEEMFKFTHSLGFWRHTLRKSTPKNHEIYKFRGFSSLILYFPNALTLYQ